MKNVTLVVMVVCVLALFTIISFQVRASDNCPAVMSQEYFLGKSFAVSLQANFVGSRAETWRLGQDFTIRVGDEAEYLGACRYQIPVTITNLVRQRRDAYEQTDGLLIFDSRTNFFKIVAGEARAESTDDVLLKTSFECGFFYRYKNSRKPGRGICTGEDLWYLPE